MATSPTLRRDFIKKIGQLSPRSVRGTAPTHRPLLLLWLLGRVAAGAPRLATWRQTRAAFEKLEAVYGNGATADSAQYPFWVLHATDALWEIKDADRIAPPTGRRRPTISVLEQVNPEAGFTPDVYAMLRADPSLTANAAATLLARFFNPVPVGLVAAVGLDGLLRAGREADLLLPIPGSVAFPKRTAIHAELGGQWTSGIGTLDDGLMCVFSDAKGPYDDRTIPGTDLIEYRGQGLSGDQTLKGGGNAQLLVCQQEQKPIRYWHQPADGAWGFDTWTVIVDRRLVWGKGDDKQWRREFAWVLAPVPSPFRDQWPQSVLDRLAQDDQQTHDETLGTEAPTAVTKQDAGRQYRKLCASVERKEAVNHDRTTRIASDRYFRSADARMAVMLRAQGTCENPDCGGQPTDVTDKGDAILEVDHVDERATQGRDHPANMIALCPNCHAIKTRGSTRRDLKRKLKTLAERLHREAEAWGNSL
ncbi:HNH endonuclease signature motif containing protein [Microbispora sp. CA-102843]|uniref:HNH endonuclease signature motif containing protein n=1 Tax=Microbispora sp. CA-102843 TaxID=3239952 RepID=UPI003D94B5A9